MSTRNFNLFFRHSEGTGKAPTKRRRLRRGAPNLSAFVGLHFHVAAIADMSPVSIILANQSGGYAPFRAALISSHTAFYSLSFFVFRSLVISDSVRFIGLSFLWCSVNVMLCGLC